MANAAFLITGISYTFSGKKLKSYLHLLGSQPFSYRYAVLVD